MVLTATPAPWRLHLAAAAALSAAVLSGCGGGAGDSGPRVRDDPQSISFDAAPSLQVAANAPVKATASSGLAVTYSSQTPAVCTVEPGTGQVTGASIGSCAILANQGGNDRFAPAPQAQLTFIVSGRTQTVSLEAPAELAVDASASLRASSSSGLALRFSSLTPQVCAVEAESGVARGLSRGACTVAVDQPGDLHWAAAPQVTRELIIQALPQSLDFVELPALQVGASVKALAIASSDMPVGFVSLTPAVCAVVQGSPVVSGVAAGVCTIAAEQAGDGRWAPAAAVQRSVAVARVSQTLAFGAAPSGLVVGGAVTVRATAGSGLDVAYSSLTPGICSVNASSGSVTGLAVGNCTVAANQGGNTTWAPAEPASQVLAVAGVAQRLSFAAAPPLTAGGTATVRATASSGLAPGYTSLTPARCSVSAAGVVTSLAAGDCTIAADQPGDARWAPAPQATQVLSASFASQTLAFATAPALTVGGTATVRATATSGLAVSYASLSPTICSVNAGTGVVSGLAIGNCSIAASQAGNATWAAAPQVTQPLAVAGMAQSLSFTAAPPITAGGTATVRATASSGLAPVYSSLTPSICSVSALGLVTSLASGVCTVAANQAGDGRWAPAPQVTQILSANLTHQSLSFSTAPALAVDATATVRATATSGLAVSYASLSSTVCSVDASTGVVSGLAIGSCSIAANQAGNAVWAPASQLTQTLTVAGLAQSLSFAAAPALTAGGTATVRATASSGLAAGYTSLTPASCSVSASGLVTSLAAGNCTIAADQPGDARWAPAPQATQVLSASFASQTVSFAAAPALTVGGTATVRATATSGLAVSYASLSATICSVSEGTGVVTGLATGSCSIAASQAGNATWAAAPQVTQTLAVAGRGQSVAFGAAPALTAGSTATVRAVATSGLAVSYSSSTPTVCTVDAVSGVVSGLAQGSCSIAASQAGNSQWAAAATVAQTLPVAPNPNQTLAFGAAPSLTLGGTATVRATASSGLAVSYSSLTPGLCSVQAASGLVSGLAIGDCVVAANQAGDASYNPAPQVLQTVPVRAAAGSSVPGTPQGVTARLGANVATVLVSVGSLDGGGYPVTGYTVQSQPAGLTVTSSTAPVTVTCPTSCAGYAFSVSATNALGTGSASAAVDVLTTFDVVTTFYEPDTQPRDSIFTGSFTLNSTSGAITGLAGRLTESMTGNAVGSAPYYDMTQVTLSYQLQSWRDNTLGGRFVASFAKNTTSTFTTVGGGDGWSPQAGIANGGVYAGFPASYGGTIKNSSVLIFVPDNPFAPLTAAQLAKLAYADCAPGGMMGAVCMTATSVAGYGSVGTMSGYPVSQTLVRR